MPRDGGRRAGVTAVSSFDKSSVVDPLIQSTVLAFVEDPGGANAIAAMLPGLADGADLHVLASEVGAAQLAAHGVASDVVEAEVEAETLVDGLRPSCVVVGTSEDSSSFGLRLVQAARRRGLPTIGVVDGPANAAWRFRGGGGCPLASAPDWIAVPDEATAEAYSALGHPAERVVTAGEPHLARVAGERSRFEAAGQRTLRKMLFPQLDSARQWIVFLTERSDGLDSRRFRRNADYTLPALQGEDRRTHIVLAAFLKARRLLEPPPVVLLRLHPKEDAADYNAYRPAFDAVSQTEPALELVFAADLVVGMTTMLMAEAVALGRPALAVLPRVEEATWLPADVRGLIPVVARQREIAPALRAGLRHGACATPDFTHNAGALNGLVERALRRGACAESA